MGNIERPSFCYCCVSRVCALILTGALWNMVVAGSPVVMWGLCSHTGVMLVFNWLSEFAVNLLVYMNVPMERKLGSAVVVTLLALR